MRLCALGWYGHRNAGDDRVAEALIHGFAGHHITFLPFLPLPPEIVNHFDGVVLSAGNWHPRNRLALDFERWSRRVHVPIVACGLGVEAMPREAHAGARALVERAASIWLRDDDSRSLLAEVVDDAHAERLQVGPDVTWAHPFSPVPPKTSTRVALNLRSWQQTPWQPDDWLTAARNLVVPTDVWSLAPEDWVLLRTFEPDLENAFDPAPARRASVVVGMRLHSLIFASQMALPTIGLAYDPKVSRFLSSIGRGDHVLGLDQPQHLAAAVDAAHRAAAADREDLLARGQALTARARTLFAQTTEALEAEKPRRSGLAGRALVGVGRWLLHRGHALRRPEGRS